MLMLCGENSVISSLLGASVRKRVTMAAPPEDVPDAPVPAPPGTSGLIKRQVSVAPTRRVLPRMRTAPPGVERQFKH